MTHIVRASAAAVLVLLAGCAGQAGPIPAVTLTMPEQWRGATAPTTPNTASAAVGAVSLATSVDTTWWDGFGDPALSLIVTEALARNGDLRVARGRLLEFRSRVGVARSAQLPMLSANANPVRARMLNGFGQPFDTTVIATQLEASYEVDLWGRLQALSDSSLAAYQAEAANLDAAGLSIAASTASAYLNLRGLDAQLELSRATLALRLRSLELARKGNEAGYSSRLELLQAQAEYDATAETVPQLERNIFEQETALAILAGRSPSSAERGLPLASLAVPTIPAGLPAGLLQRRPDIYRAQQQLRAQVANLEASKDQLLPALRLTISGGAQAPGLHQLLTSPLTLWRLAGNLAQPLLEGGRLQAQTDIAAAQRDQAFYQYENTVRGALVETENGLAALTRLREQAAINTARRSTAAEALRIARNRHRNGYSSYLEELDAQRTLFAVESSQLQLHARLLVASVDLYRALGGGWSARQ
jgi:NodT family efflux transporter outer membrane factor (OMF) lipoprotein